MAGGSGKRNNIAEIDDASEQSFIWIKVASLFPRVGIGFLETRIAMALYSQTGNEAFLAETKSVEPEVAELQGNSLDIVFITKTELKKGFPLSLQKARPKGQDYRIWASMKVCLACYLPSSRNSGLPTGFFFYLRLNFRKLAASSEAFLLWEDALWNKLISASRSRYLFFEQKSLWGLRNETMLRSKMRVLYLNSEFCKVSRKRDTIWISNAPELPGCEEKCLEILDSSFLSPNLSIWQNCLRIWKEK